MPGSLDKFDSINFQVLAFGNAVEPACEPPLPTESDESPLLLFSQLLNMIARWHKIQPRTKRKSGTSRRRTGNTSKRMIWKSIGHFGTTISLAGRFLVQRLCENITSPTGSPQTCPKGSSCNRTRSSNWPFRSPATSRSTTSGSRWCGLAPAQPNRTQ